ncbi:MAG TPA: Rieske 2Fe-2S domain-containing protein [Bryobacteraceae bacterium]|nr:Rieske 2Fe-2S domain-containing protein [Bryobacteraceae bacterium]
MTNTELDVTIGQINVIPPGEGRNFDVAGERIAVFHARSGQVFAVQAACPHKGGPLADGLVGGGILICPLHAWKFDLNSGEALTGSCSLKTYPVRVDEEGCVVLTVGGSQH